MDPLYWCIFDIYFTVYVHLQQPTVLTRILLKPLVHLLSEKAICSGASGVRAASIETLYHGGVISRGTDGLQSLPHASRVIELKMWLNSLPVSEFSSSNCPSESIARCFVLAHVSWQKTGVVCGSALVNRSTDCSVHPRFLIRECPYCYRFSGLVG